MTVESTMLTRKESVQKAVGVWACDDFPHNNPMIITNKNDLKKYFTILILNTFLHIQNYTFFW